MKRKRNYTVTVQQICHQGVVGGSNKLVSWKHVSPLYGLFGESNVSENWIV